ncbi:hypothetical protein RRG08_055237 [Elysia crispata]|uniref:Uncharacterized protein n=1 Tax=Elysia crispata TaxID=231223 RepID=A0AAE0XUZ7_9GAST|nr:hypothetical protein RRG08_055237 [Elysia crispata]
MLFIVADDPGFGLPPLCGNRTIWHAARERLGCLLEENNTVSTLPILQTPSPTPPLIQYYFEPPRSPARLFSCAIASTNRHEAQRRPTGHESLELPKCHSRFMNHISLWTAPVCLSQIDLLSSARPFEEHEEEEKTTRSTRRPRVMDSRNTSICMEPHSILISEECNKSRTFFPHLIGSDKKQR